MDPTEKRIRELVPSSFRRSRRSLRLWALVVVLLSLNGANGAIAIAQCSHCAHEGGVEVSFDSDSIWEADGTLHTDLHLGTSLGVCPHCGSGSETNSYEFDAWRGETDRGSQACDDYSYDGMGGRRFSRTQKSEIDSCAGLHSRLQIRAGAVFMDRVNEGYRVLTASTSSPIRQLNAEKFDFDWRPGLDVSASLLAWDETEFEVRFLGLREFTANQSVGIQGSEVRIDSDPPVFAPNVQSIAARYSSQLYGFEVNYHYVTYCPFNYIAGFRYVALDEDLGAVLNADPQAYGLRTETHNDLYGLQIGVTSVPDMPLFGWRWLSWFGKVGIFGNDAQQQTVLETDMIGQIVSESPGTSAVVWEFGLGLDIPLSDRFTVHGGYSALILDRISVASDQLGTIDFLSATGSDNRGTVMFHGAALSLVVTH